MTQERNLLIVIADGEHVRFVRTAADNALHSQATASSPAVHQRSADLGSDHPGASMHSASTAHHVMTPRHDPHVLAKEQFAHSVARELNAGAAGGAFDELILVAPARALAEMRAALDPAAVSKVIGTLSKDLVKTPDSELWPHLRQWVKPVHRTVT